MSNDKDIVVSGATLADKPELWRLFRMAHAESGVSPIDEAAVDAFLDQALNKKQGVIAVIRGEGSEIRAYILLLLTGFWYNPQCLHLEELSAYVAPEHRKSKCADALIRYAQHAARQLNVPLIIGIFTNDRLMEKVRLYRRRLGMPAGAFFVDNTDYVPDRAPDLSTWKDHTRTRRKKDIAPIEAVIATAVLEGQLPLINGKL